MDFLSPCCEIYGHLSCLGPWVLFHCSGISSFIHHHLQKTQDVDSLVLSARIWNSSYTFIWLDQPIVFVLSTLKLMSVKTRHRIQMCLLLAKWGSPPDQKQFYGWVCLFFFSLFPFLWKLPVGLKHNNTLWEEGREEGRVRLISGEPRGALPAQISLQTGQALWEGGAAKTRNCLRRWSFFCDHILALEPPSNPSLSFRSSLFPHSLAPWRERRNALRQMPVLALWYLALLCCPRLRLLVFVYFVCFYCFFLFKRNLNFPLPCLPLMSAFMVGVVLSLPKSVR